MEEVNPGPSSSTKRIKTRRPERNPKKDNTNEEQPLSEFHIGHTKWTLKELRLVLEGLQKFGLTRIGAIAELLPNRTYDQVRAYLWRAGRQVHKLNAKDRELENIIGKNEDEEAAVGVTMGISERLKKPCASTKQLAAVTKSLLLIENLEQHPPLTGPKDIDFKQLYTALYMAMKGYPLPDMNEATLKFFCESFYNVPRAASAYPIESFPLEDCQALENLAGNITLNPLSLQIDSLKARIGEPTNDESYKRMKDWLSKSDWCLL